MKIVLEYNFTTFEGTYCERLRETVITRQATPKETREEALRTVYKMVPLASPWRMEAMEAGKVVLVAWGYGHSLDGYTQSAEIELSGNTGEFI